MSFQMISSIEWLFVTECFTKYATEFTPVHHSSMLDYQIIFFFRIQKKKFRSKNARKFSRGLEHKKMNSVPMRNFASSKVNNSIWFVVVALFMIVWRSNAVLAGAEIRLDTIFFSENRQIKPFGTYQQVETQIEGPLTVPSYNSTLFGVE